MLSFAINPLGLLSLFLLFSSTLVAASGRGHSSRSPSRRQNNRNGNNNNNNNLQASLTLDASQIQSNLANNGQDPPVAGQVASLTSTNNFINFCATTNLALTNGNQVIAGSCNPTPMGSIIAQGKAPSCKFSNPKNGDTIAADTTFTMTMNIVNLQTGSFTNAQKTYFAAPAQLNGNGILIGHSHVVIESIASLDSTTPADTTKFAFFKGLNNAANNGVLSATVTGGLPAGFYKMSSINSAANHQPALVGVAQHGSLDDAGESLFDRPTSFPF
ncbi:hypothetical protein BDY24DRAFT_233534 [Mrakia frigida]|uniref:uncharacterized protein n=1 Tax=Mrakia frigida TaxID=29902 RepID=UPI003FCC1237